MSITVDLNAGGGTGTTNFTEQTSVLLFSGANLTTGGGTDPNSIDTLTVALTNHTATQTLSLSAGAATAASTNGITVSFNATTGILTLTGSNENNSVWQTILRGVTFNDTSNSPVNPTTVTVTATNTAPGRTPGTDTHSMTVTQVNDNPVASNVTGSAGENGGAVLITASVTDPDVTDTFTYTINTTGTLGSVTNNNNGTFSYNANGAFESLAVGQTAQTTFTYTANDGHGGTSTATATVTITGANDIPVAANVNAGVDEDGPGFVINPSFTDVDSGDTHTITIDTTGTQGSVTNNPNGTFTYNPNSAFEDLALGETAQDTFTYIVHDNHSGNSVVKTVTVTITGANDAPSVADVSRQFQRRRRRSGQCRLQRYRRQRHPYVRDRHECHAWLGGQQRRRHLQL